MSARNRIQSNAAISDKEISVVVQGPVLGSQTDAPSQRFTARCLESVRRHLPKATLILSTWEGTDTRGLTFDRLILSVDPGTVWFDTGGRQIPNNVNRQIVSTLAGLQAGDRKYALKLRSDARLRHTGFSHYFGKFRARSPQWKAFEERVVISDHFTRNPERGLAWLFHPSDWFLFGRTEDLQTLWNVPLVSSPSPTPATALYNEQWIWVNCLRKFGELNFHSFDQDTSELRRTAEMALANNFVVLTRSRFGAEAQKYQFDLRYWLPMYTHADWRQLYRRHCDPDLPLVSEMATCFKDFCQALDKTWPRGLGLLSRILRRFPALGARL